MGTAVQERVEPLIVRVGGRAFRTSAKTTLKQDMYLWGELEKANLSSLLQHYDSEHDQLSNIGTKIVLQAWQTGALFRVMGGVLIEEGTKWSEEQAVRNATFLEELDDEEDKKIIRTQMVAVVLHFFVSEAGLRKISQKSLQANEKSPGQSDPSVEQTTSASGITLSENSQTTIH